MTETLSQAIVRELFSYDETSGVLTWKVSRGRAKPGKVAGSVIHTTNGKDYLRLSIAGTDYYVHRVIWLWLYGSFPEHEIDHEDGDGLNNRRGNLRASTKSENALNLSLSKRSTTGVTGVSVEKNGSFRAHIRKDGKQKTLGRFPSLDLAAAARKSAEADLGFHPHHGQPRGTRS